MHSEEKPEYPQVLLREKYKVLWEWRVNKTEKIDFDYNQRTQILPLIMKDGGWQAVNEVLRDSPTLPTILAHYTSQIMLLWSHSIFNYPAQFYQEILSHAVPRGCQVCMEGLNRWNVLEIKFQMVPSLQWILWMHLFRTPTPFIPKPKLQGLL